MAGWSRAISGMLAAGPLLCLTPQGASAAPEPAGNPTVVCASRPGERIHCPADTSAGGGIHGRPQQVAKYMAATPESIQLTADLINRHPDRFLFGTDEVAPSSQEGYLKVYEMYRPLVA